MEAATRAAGLEQLYQETKTLIEALNRYQTTSQSSIAKKAYAAQAKAQKSKVEILINQLGQHETNPKNQH